MGRGLAHGPGLCGSASVKRASAVLRSGYIRMPPYSASISTFSILLLLGGGLLVLVQPIELLYDLRVFQLDDLAGEVVEGIFLRVGR